MRDGLIDIFQDAKQALHFLSPRASEKFFSLATAQVAVDNEQHVAHVVNEFNGRSNAFSR